MRLPCDYDRFGKPRAVGDAIECLLEERAIPEQIEERFGPLRPAKRPQPRTRTAAQDHRLYQLAPYPNNFGRQVDSWLSASCQLKKRCW